MNIKSLTLYSPNLAAQTHFYSKVLGLPILHQSEQKVSFEVGKSLLIFEKRSETKPYHFAINIPSNKTKEALSWLKKRVAVLKNDNLEIQDFDFWNAEAMYFYDADNNIAELIARKNLENNSEEPFDETQWLEISEIGLGVDDIEKVFDFLHNNCQLAVHSGSFSRFCAIGSENGLFICINRAEKKIWFPTNDAIFVADFKVSIHHLDKSYDICFENGTLSFA
ncbi:MAG: VOC family protein [Chitinophagales bacterium]